MHHVSEICIRNFKSISDGTFPLSSYTPLVGYNNAGKTNILKALCWAIKKSSLQAEDFHRTTASVEIEVEISGITDQVMDALGDGHRRRLEPLLADGKIRLRRIQAEPGQSAANIRLKVLRTDGGTREWVANPNGIDAAISAMFPEPIYIGAMENAAEDVAKFGSSTTIGKLLKEITAPVVRRYTPQVADALRDIKARLTANSDNKDETLAGLDAMVQRQLDLLFPGVTAKTHVPVPEFSDLLKSATIKIFEEGFDNPDGRDPASFGHGAQRSVQIALIKCLADVRRQAGGDAGRTTLLLIDEPELYLHPQAIEVVKGALKRLAQDGYQVVVTTHSPNMISREDAPNALLVRRNAADGTRCYPRMKDVVQAAIDGAEHQSETLFLLSNSTKILFSEKVAITEGKTERNVMPAMFEHLFGITPGEDKLGFVDVGGVHNVPSAMKVLSAMGIPCKAIVDLDFIFRTAPHRGLIDEADADVAVCREVFAALRDQQKIVLDDAGLPKGHTGGPASAAFELLAQHADAIPCIDRLHGAMLEHGIWFWKRGAIEAHLGISKSGSAQMHLVDSLAERDFIERLPDYASVASAIRWLRE